MAIDTWEKLIHLPNSEYKFLVHINPGKHLECGSDWTSEGSNTYSTDISEVNLNAVTDDGSELTERSSVALVQANAGSWYFDLYAQKLYVRASDDDDLSNSATTCIIIMFVWKYYATDNGKYDGYKHKALVRQDSLPNMDLTVDDIVEGMYKFNFGSFTMNNDGEFDTASDEYLWFNRKVLVYIGGESLPFVEYALYFVGRISDMIVKDESVLFSVKDIRVGTFSNLPLEKYWKADYPFLRDSDEGKPKPIFYGEKEEIVPIMLKPFNDTGFYALAEDYPSSFTDESSAAKDATENDMTLLPASPAVGDAYYFGHTTNKFGRIDINFYQEGIGTFTVEWFYAYAPGGNWRRLKWCNLSDGTNGFTQGTGWQTVSFTIPHGTWEKRTINGTNAYWVQARGTGFTSISQQPKGSQVVLHDTVGSQWKIADHEIEDIVGIKKNDVALGASDWSETLSSGEFSLNVQFNIDSDTLSVHAQGKKVSGTYVTKGADIEKDILKSYLSFLDADLDLTSFTNTNSVRTYPLALYLDSEQSSREVLQKVGRSTVAFLAPTEDGKLSFEAYEPTVEPGTLELRDSDFFDDWEVVKDHKFVRKKVVLKYDRSPKTQEWKVVEKTNPDVVSKYGINEILELETYVKLAADADTVAGGIRDMCSKPITTIKTSFGMKGFKLFPTRKVVVTRERAADASGAFSQKVFRVTTVGKSSTNESTHIVAQDDLQTLGESFCYVCFTCQTCFTQEASCSLCYTCQLCVVTQEGCAVCDTCQLCNTAQSGCVTCDSCQVCDTCQSTVGTCPTCEDCDTCVRYLNCGC